MRVFVVEDEAVVARRLHRLITKILGRGLTSLDHAGTLQEALDRLQSQPIDVLFLDLNLRGEDGFRLLQEAAASPFQTIIVSAEHTQAIRAFEYGVTDFVAKPFDEDRLRTAIDRLDKNDAPTEHATRYLAVRKAREIVPIPVDTIDYIQGADDYSEIHCEDGTRSLHSKTLTALDCVLPASFERIHRSFIVNTKKVTRYSRRSGGQHEAHLISGETLPVSRTRFAALKKRMP